MSRFINILRRAKLHFVGEGKFINLSLKDKYTVVSFSLIPISTIFFGKYCYGINKNPLHGIIGCLFGFTIGPLAIPIAVISSPVLAFITIDKIKKITKKKD